MEPGRPGLRLGHAMAGTPFPLRVVVSHIGRGGAPADVDLSYVVCRPGTSECSREAAPRAAGVAEANGRVYVIEPVPTDPAPGRDFEYIEIRIAATRGQAPVASALHTVAVYPAIEVAARPPVLTLPAGPEPPLGSGGRGCAPFFLESRRGPLPTRTTPTYAVRAWLVSAPADPRFAGATFMLDGTTLDTARPGSQSPWLAGMPLTPERLLGEHTLCVRLARPGSSAASTPANVEVAFGLGEMPYDTSSVMSQPLIAGVRIAPAGWVETHLSTLALSAAALVMVLLAWYGRDRPYVARDLRAGVPAGVQRSTTVATSLGPPSLLARLLGLRASRSLHTATGIVVGSVRPVNRELYQFRPARGVRLEPAVTSGLLVAHETYEARVPGDHLVAFRLEYE
jgi:hypothetical protein